MKAVVLTAFGNIENLVLAELKTPVPEPDQVLIRVKAFSINPVDSKTRQGKGQAENLKKSDPMILGWDVSGVIEHTGAQVAGFKQGDEVFGLVCLPGQGKTYAEYVIVPFTHLAHKPAGISHAQAAAAGLAALTAWQALYAHGRVKTGDRVLIHAAAGGVGHFAVQLARYLGAYVIGTSSAHNRQFVLELGANEHVDYVTQPIENLYSDLDLVLDTIGGANIDRSLPTLKPGGTLICIPSGNSGSVAEKANAVGKKGLFFLVQSSGEDMKFIASLLASGQLKAHVSATYRIEDIQEAHRQIETGRTRGKIVVLMDEP